MHLEAADERDSTWENLSPRFRVYLFDTEHGITSTYDVTDADVLEVIDWARGTAGSERLYAVGLVQADGVEGEIRGRGVVWLLGADLVNAVPEELSDKERHILERMEARRAQGPPGPSTGQVTPGHSQQTKPHS